MPRCTMSVPVPQSISRYLPRLRTSRIVVPREREIGLPLHYRERDRPAVLKRHFDVRDRLASIVGPCFRRIGVAPCGDPATPFVRSGFLRDGTERPLVIHERRREILKL